LANTGRELITVNIMNKEEQDEVDPKSKPTTGSREVRRNAHGIACSSMQQICKSHDTSEKTCFLL
jgi:hypothetical protein